MAELHLQQAQAVELSLAALANVGEALAESNLPFSVDLLARVAFFKHHALNP